MRKAMRQVGFRVVLFPFRKLTFFFRLFDCGIHKCEKTCHPPSTSPPPCPRSPSLVTYCPCGKKSLNEIEGGARTTCSDPISTCGNTCMKPLEGCDHVCSVTCQCYSFFHDYHSLIRYDRPYRSLSSLFDTYRCSMPMWSNNTLDILP